jgi:DNA-binding NarL/FixJ family response regulator
MAKPTELSLEQKKIQKLEARALAAEARVQALEDLHKQGLTEIDKIKSQLALNVSRWVMPLLYQLRETTLSETQRITLLAIIATLDNILLPFQGILSAKFSNLTGREIEVASLVKIGLKSQKIAEQLGISKRAVEFHRDSIRKKLKIKKIKQNLRAYLASMV